MGTAAVNAYNDRHGGHFSRVLPAAQGQRPSPQGCPGSDLSLRDVLGIIDQLTAARVFSVVNATASEMLDRLEQPTTAAALAQTLSACYPEVDGDQVRRDVDAMLHKLVERGFVVASPGSAPELR
jgi:hypothetical protein